MQKISEFIEETNNLLGVKSAFVPAPQQGQPQGGDPSQGGQPQGGGGDQAQQMFQQVSQMVQSLPPEVQQQIAPQLQQIQQLPPDQQVQALQQIAQGLQGQGQGQPQGGDPSQGGQPPAGAPGDDPSATAATGSSAQAENSLDNTQVTLTVRQLMDLTSGGKATQSLLKVKQMSHAHNQKQQANQQQMQQKAQEAQMAQQQAGPMGGGIYPGGAPGQ